MRGDREFQAFVRCVLPMATVSWSLARLTGDTAFIVDDDAGGMSVTNAAELVCLQCFERFGNRRIVYRDTIGNWDELMHDHGHFVGFKPCSLHRDELPA